MNAAETLAASAARYSERVAVEFGDARVTYSALNAGVRRLSGGLRDLGLQRSDRVALLLGNSPEFVRTYYAVVGQGLVAVPINPILKVDEVTHILNDCGAAALIVDATLRPLVESVQSRVSGLKHVIFAGRDVSIGDVSLGSLEAGDEQSPAAVDLNQVAHIVYTSGTTGRPKGAMITHDNLTWMIGALVRFFDETPADVVVCALPLFHAYALLQCMLTPLSVGARMVLLERFTPDGAMTAIQREHATSFFGVPTMYVMMLNAALERYDLSSLRLCVSGGASIPVEVLRRFQDTAKISICEGYGLSEMTVMAICNPPHGVQKPGSIGLPLPGLDARVVARDGQEQPRGLAGEIVVRGPSTMLGYWGQPDATRNALEGGWLHTGDVGTCDADGYFYVVDRMKDMYIRGGYNVYPREIEEVLYSHPAVMEAAVVGLPDPVFGEEGVAFVVLAPGHPVPASDLIDYCRARLADYKVPRQIEFSDGLPKSSTGKTLKRELHVPSTGSTERG